MTGHGLERHADVKALRDIANRSIAQAGMLPDSVAAKKGGNL